MHIDGHVVNVLFFEHGPLFTFVLVLNPKNGCSIHASFGHFFVPVSLFCSSPIVDCSMTACMPFYTIAVHYFSSLHNLEGGLSAQSGLHFAPIPAQTPRANAPSTCASLEKGKNRTFPFPVETPKHSSTNDIPP